ncbi:MAG: hypothetical protein WDN46_12565 [Methylocella sp.]
MTTTLITGVPRSGTTLVCACLNTLPNCVALAEPMRVPVHGDVERAIQEIVTFAETTRTCILLEKLAPSLTINGMIADNFFEDTTVDGSPRRHIAKPINLEIDKPLDTNFHFFIKHPAIFTALAPRLEKEFPLYAIVRHPIAALASWQSVDLPVRNGRLPVAEAYVPELRERLDRIDNSLGRQIALLQWIFQVYRRLPRERVLTYESIVDDPDVALRPLSGSSASISHTVRSIDLQTRYPNVDFRSIAEALLPIETDVEPFYPYFAASLRPYIGANK